jgi:hypothetical protein
MKGDFTRDTFEPKKHYRQVLMQQGRVQLDADWNEQAAIAGRRGETTTEDIIGDCGAPADHSGFGVVTDLTDLTKVPAAVADWFNALAVDEANRIKGKLATGDFLLTPGRYYVDGRQCELEAPLLFSEQPDLPGQKLLPGKNLLFLDVWPRHITALEDPQLLDPALGGVDTATRVKTVWQVRAQTTNAADCAAGADVVAGLEHRVRPQLKARTDIQPNNDDPCQLPETAGYKGLENQLYRIEIHQGSLDEKGNPAQPKWKWSRENGSVVTAITDFTNGTAGSGPVITVTSTGRDDVLGFKDGDIVELLDDQYEWESRPGHLALIDGNPTNNLIKLKTYTGQALPTAADLDLSLHAKLRRWEGVADVKRPGTNGGYLEIESGIQIRFDSDGDGYRTGDYWLIPARAATPNAPSGDIEWPRELGPDGTPQNDQPLAEPPLGIVHHYCNLGLVTATNGAPTTLVSDCRCLWSSLTAPTLDYVSGDGQETMPDLTQPAVLPQLPMPLIVDALNGQCHSGNVKLRFRVTVGNGVLKLNPSTDPIGIMAPPGGTTGELIISSPNGLFAVTWWLENNEALLAQRVEVVLFDDNDPGKRVVAGPIYFNANLSVASRVAYQPGECQGLAGRKTVQDAISRLATMPSLYKISGDGQEGTPGTTLQPLVVLAANRCGPVEGLTVKFKVISGGGTVAPAAAVTDANGLASCKWILGPQPATQEVEAELIAADADHPVTAPGKVRFSANLAGIENDPRPAHIIAICAGKPLAVLANDSTIQFADFKTGIALFCDQVILPETVLDPKGMSAIRIQRGQPTCFVTVEIPYPLLESELRDCEPFKLGMYAGFRPLVLLGQIDVEATEKLPNGIHADEPRSMITWVPAAGAVQFMSGVLGRVAGIKPLLDRVLLRLTLKGNFIWDEAAKELFKEGTPGGFLDGESFRATKQFNPSLLALPSGDGMRGGDFEMWFWLAVSEKKRTN